jgi:hypothetical protein
MSALKMADNPAAVETLDSQMCLRDVYSARELQQLCDEIVEQGYMEGRVLADGSIALLGDLLMTRAIYLGGTRYGWSRRFCFRDRELASARFKELRSEDDEPAGWTARRPDRPCRRHEEGATPWQSRQ